MPNWSSVLQEIAKDQALNKESSFDKIRRKYLKRLHSHTNRNVIAYYSGFLSKPQIDGTQINDEDKNGFMLCIHELDRTKGLDLILHTPGGDGHATESLVEYLRDMFKNDIRAIVPQISMSAGTMLAFSCKEILMGKQSSLGPIDPQFGAIAAVSLLKEVEKARDEIISDPNTAHFWSPILSNITPSFLERCEMAVKFSREFIEKTLAENMLSHETDESITAKISSISELFSNNAGSAHNTHFQANQCRDAGLNIVQLEDDSTLQDLVLTIHHCYMHSLGNTPAFKIIENHKGKAFVKMEQSLASPVLFNASGPS